ncbi:MAG: HlyC/CorC family transporter [Rhodothermales bacterium]|nr:HlyC/CorC family transporter [Rhodothermales bacterium]MBO6780543.1 HlyC/CorC family transporter [Rhodothermales bacterium]
MDPDPNWAHTVGLLLQDAPDPGSLLTGLGVLLTLLLFSALFSGSEVALFSLEATTREEMALEPDRADRRVLRLLERPGALLITILILNTVVNVGAAILAAVITHDLAQAYEWNPALTVFGEVIVLTFVLLIVSEISPKLLASTNARAFSRRISGFLLLFHRVLLPLSGWVAQRMQAFHGRFESTGTRLSADDLKTMAEIGEAHGTIQEDERELIHSIVEFGETTVREIMISRLDIIAISSEASLEQAIETIRTSGHSRIPMFAGHLDNILGILYAKDILRLLHSGRRPRSMDWARFVRPPFFVPQGKKLDDLLTDFQTRKTHIALVVDEYGGTAGLVTLEDVLEEIVGEIQDEHDDAETALYEALSDGSYLFDARIDLDDLNEVLGLSLDTASFDFETLGGLIFHLAGAIPEESDELVFENLRLRVETVETNRIGQVALSIDPDSGALPADQSVEDL